MTRRRLLFVGVLIALACILLGVWYQAAAKMDVTINIDSSYNEPLLQLEELKNDKKKTIQTITETTNLALTPGRYSLWGEETADFANYYAEFEVSDEPIAISVDPWFSESQLQTLLEKENSEIMKKANQTFDIPRNHEIQGGKLFAEGDWYGGYITEDLSASELQQTYVDVYRFIMRKQGEVWVVVTKTPLLLISTQEYKEVPREVIVETNKLYTSESSSEDLL